MCVINAPVTNAGARSQENLGNIINSLVVMLKTLRQGREKS